ncbi:MAG: hypothetical protein J7501_13820 [Bdellovibrio sp.]|nr:hypothetical protein [Bdellovibrio sp.]
MASNQRMFFYLARWGQGSLPDAATTKNILDMVRGYSVEEVQMNGRPRLVSLPLRQYQVFQTGSEQFNDAFEEHSFLKLLLNGFTEEIGGQTMERNFINDTELNQRRRFFRPGNLKYVLPGIAQSAENNKATVDLLMKNLKSNRLTLINIKSEELAQHVVLAKSFKIEKDGTILINSYDSTFDFETSIRYNPRSGQFTDAVTPIKWDWWETPSTTPESVIGVFIVGEEERAPIEQAMLRYYRDLCE